MQEQKLPIPNPEDWVTVEGAMRILRLSKQQVIRYLADQRLKSYRFYGARDKWAERMIWRNDAEAFADALRAVRKPGLVERVRRAGAEW